MRAPRTSLKTVVSHVLAGLVCASMLTAAPGCASAPAAKAQTTGAGREYAFWPSFPQEPRVQFLRAFSSSEDVSPTENDTFSQLVFGAESKGAQGINKPYGVTMKNGRIYVCDIRTPCLTVLDIPKKQTRLVGVSGLNRLQHPVDVAVADDGMIYVADNKRAVIVVFDKDEKFSTVFGRKDLMPIALAVHGDRLYVCDMTGHSVEVLDRLTGKTIGVIGKVGDGDGEFRLPLGVATDTKGNVYVVDLMRCRVQKFSPDGAYLAGVGTTGDYPGAFVRPKHISVDAAGNLYVVDAAFQNVQMFDERLQLLLAFGAAGGFPGSMDLPVGVCTSDEGLELFANDLNPGFDAKRLVIVTNQFGPAKVSVYAVGERRPSYSLQDMASSAAKVTSGLGSRPDILKLQNIGTEEPQAPEGAQGEPPAAPAPGATPPPTPKQPGAPRE